MNPGIDRMEHGSSELGTSDCQAMKIRHRAAEDRWSMSVMSVVEPWKVAGRGFERFWAGRRWVLGVEALVSEAAVEALDEGVVDGAGGATALEHAERLGDDVFAIIPSRRPRWGSLHRRRAGR
jgi:hypothetical protein